MTSSSAIGIDLGTSRCALTRFDRSGRTEMIRSSQGDMLIPSIVYFEDDELLFGRAANQAAVTEPGRAAEFVKRDLGRASYSRAIGGELLPVELIEACLLKNLCADLPAVLGGAPAAVLSAPASFDQAQRRGIVDAARMAGIDVLGTISDPLAAALAFAEVQGYLAADTAEKPGCRVLVFDLGGGKLDVAIVEIKPGHLRTLAVGGDPRLGGRDWDLKLADHVAAAFAKQFGDDPRYDMTSVRRLLAGAEEAKHTLTARQQARVHIERDAHATDIVVARYAFEEATADLVDRARTVTDEMVAQAGLAWRDLAHLVLIGGASRMPMIGSMIETLTGLKAATNMHADEAVARGAALHAEHLLAAREGRKSPVSVQITDLTAHSVGVEWRDPGNGRAENVVLIPRGTELPCGTSSKMVTQTDDQTSIETCLVEGESRDADECSRIARIKIVGLPSELPANSPIDVFYQVTAEGRLTVKAQLQKSRQALTIEVERVRGLTEGEIVDWKRLLETNPGLKTIHTLLARHAEQQAARAPADEPSHPAPMPVGLVAGPSSDEDFQLDMDASAGPGRFRKSRTTPRSILIMLAGHVVFALLGLAIGYYILMMLRPEWNVFDLRLPGLPVAVPQGQIPPASLP